MGGDVVGRLTVVGTLGQPLPDRLAVSRGVIIAPATKTKRQNTLKEGNPLARFYHNGTDQKVVLQELQTIRLALLSLARMIMLQLGPGQKRNSGWERTYSEKACRT